MFATLLLAYTNGANDNFKGVATLYGSGTVGYKTAISIATIATFLGSICAIFFAQGLIASFSGKGLVPQDIAGTTNFLIATGFGAACTVLLATRLGFPISTTHSLVGGLLGAGVVAAGSDVNFYKLGGTFFIPLLLSPFIAFALGAIVYSLFIRSRRAIGLTKDSCICIGEPKQFIPLSSLTNSNANAAAVDSGIQLPSLTLAAESECVDIYRQVLGSFCTKTSGCRSYIERSSRFLCSRLE